MYMVDGKGQGRAHASIRVSIDHVDRMSCVCSGHVPPKTSLLLCLPQSTFSAVSPGSEEKPFTQPLKFHLHLFL